MINFTHIGKLNVGDKSVNVKGIVSFKGAVREVKSRFTSEILKVCNCTLVDETGSIQLILWNNNISRIAEGDFIAVEYSYVSDFKGETQLNIGKYGKIVKLDA